jgi:uncharacterized membrane protein YhaH (DUF805 family)
MTLHSLFALFFSLEGRIGRMKFWLGLLVYLLAFTALWGAIYFLFLLSQSWVVIPSLEIALAIIVVLIGWFGLFAIGTKRLHDRGKSGAWMLVFMVPTLALSLLSEALGESLIAIGLSVAGFAFVIWALIELGLLRGTTGENQYGDDPLVPSAC